MHTDRFEMIHQFSPGILRSVIPVSLAFKWSPFPAATELFGKPIKQKFQKDDSRAFACAVWRPRIVDRRRRAISNVHERHFRELVPRLVERIEKLDSDFFMAGMIGWDYQTAKNYPMSSETEKAMRDYGYVYTQRAMS
ncbi:hypothetical protein [Planctomycetes bacterium TBK1r]|uniref:hypothetical protein n=1 Tax=Stieleria magnilauensis TaxID=2527963 RepID=UPI0011A1E96B